MSQLHLPSIARGLFATLALTLYLATSATSQESASEITPRLWPHEIAGISPHPEIHFGQLENGVRYLWRNRVQPSNEIQLAMHVAVGSAMETEEQRGMAHFIQHMGFHGNATLPKNDLAAWAQQIGMDFGADHNAYSDYESTVYRMNLVQSHPSVIEKALKVLRLFADQGALDPEAIQTERDVIESEVRLLDTPQEREVGARYDWTFAGTRLGGRNRRGTSETRDAFSPRSLSEFRNAWYSPENITIFLVGDFQVTPTTEIESAFGDMIARATLPPQPEAGTPSFERRCLYFEDPDLLYTTVTLAFLREQPFAPSTKEQMSAFEALAITRIMLSRRLSLLSQIHSDVFYSASFKRVKPRPFGPVTGVTFQSTCPANRWKEALSLSEQELRRALEHGFTKSEFAKAVAIRLAEAKNNVAWDVTRQSGPTLDWLIPAADGYVSAHEPAALRALTESALESLTHEQCHERLRNEVESGTLQLGLSGPLGVGEDAEKQIFDVYKASTKVKVARPKIRVSLPFEYKPPGGRVGKIASRESLERYSLHKVVFENGVRLFVAEMDSDRMETRAVFGGGELSLEPRDRGLVWIIDRYFGQLGLKGSTNSNWHRDLEGRDITLDFAVLPDSMWLSGNSNLADHKLQCELICAHLISTAWRVGQLDALKSNYADMLKSWNTSPEHHVWQHFEEALYAEDGLSRLLTAEEMSQFKVADLRDWLNPQFRTSPLDVFIWGGGDVEAAVRNATETFGTLPDREELTAKSPYASSHGAESGLRLEFKVPATTQQSQLCISYPTGDGRNREFTWSLNLLAEILNHRIETRLQDELGLAPASSVHSRTSRVLENYGDVQVRVQVPADDADRALELCLKVADNLARNGTTNEELARVRSPLITRHDDSYWINVLSRLRHDKYALGARHRERIFYFEVTASYLEPTAKRVFASDRASIAVIRPE